MHQYIFKMAANKKTPHEKFNRLKDFEGSQYSGMKVGASHKWYYDQGEWKERKITPDEWDIYYQTTKRRAGKAPEGTGAPVGTEYNWLIVAHQRVDKLDANSYMTQLEGKKFKVAHKRSGKEMWSTTEKTHRKKVIQFLEQVIQDLKIADENEEVPYTVGKKERIYGLFHRNMKELRDMAAQMNIVNRSKMSREELIRAIKGFQNMEQGPEEVKEIKQFEEPALSEKSLDELYKLARERNINGRSGMKKNELVKALKREKVHEQEYS
jgi:hypothetical protein